MLSKMGPGLCRLWRMRSHCQRPRARYCILVLDILHPRLKACLYTSFAHCMSQVSVLHRLGVMTARQTIIRLMYVRSSSTDDGEKGNRVDSIGMA